MNKNPTARLAAFILEHSEKLPATDRIGLYQDVADLFDDIPISNYFAGLAGDLQQLVDREQSLRSILSTPGPNAAEPSPAS